MRMVQCDISEVKKGYKMSSNYDIIEKFAESDMDCVKIEDYTQQTAFSCAGSLNGSIKRYHKAGIKAIVSNGNVYLIKVNKFEN